MSNLTRNEIIELINKVCVDNFNKLKPEGPLIIDALEKAGVLMLVEGEAKAGDLVEYDRYYSENNIGRHYGIMADTGIWTDIDKPVKNSAKVWVKIRKIFKRANTPVYMTKKES